LVLAGSPLFAGPAVLVALWVWGRPDQRGGLLAVTCATLIGLGINQALGAMWFEPRPFMVPIGHTLLAHPPDNSFPSDHATFLWALGAGLIATGAARRTGAVVCLYGGSVAWARVYLGMHFPIDMLASAGVGAASGGIAVVLRPLIAVAVLPTADRLYEATVVFLHLPAAVIPRGPGPGRIDGTPPFTSR
jgi:undecaprenyl-diphosphatase